MFLHFVGRVHWRYNRDLSVVIECVYRLGILPIMSTLAEYLDSVYLKITVRKLKNTWNDKWVNYLHLDPPPLVKWFLFLCKQSFKSNIVKNVQLYRVINTFKKQEGKDFFARPHSALHIILTDPIFH